MSLMSPSALLEQLQWRYATKKFDPARQIPADVWHVLEQSLVLAPSSFGLQPWKFIVVTNPDIKEKLVAASWGQTQTRDASHTVVFAEKLEMRMEDVDRHLARHAAVRGTTIESLAGFRKIIEGFFSRPPAEFDVNHWSALQVYLALGQFMTAAAVVGVDTCPMEGIIPAQYDEILGLTGTGYTTNVVATAGYRAADDRYATLPKVRFETKDVVEYRL
ncbi:MAG: NAD(P)H-dependent oxidoreductase [Pirellulales bacterium]|nr:NAD(P)H-dependent oxidoreductase [Pirellulales bacterium]